MLLTLIACGAFLLPFVLLLGDLVAEARREVFHASVAAQRLEWSLARWRMERPLTEAWQQCLLRNRLWCEHYSNGVPPPGEAYIERRVKRDLDEHEARLVARVDRARLSIWGYP